MNTRLKSLLPLFALAALAVGAFNLNATTAVSITVPQRQDNKSVYPVAASTKTLIGTFAALNSSGYLVNATDAANLRVVGLHALETDNSSGSAGDLSSRVMKGLFLVKNSASNALTTAHVGRVAFIEDNNTVSSTANSNGVVAGLVEEVTTAGVWLWVGLPYNNGAAPTAVSITSAQNSTVAATDLPTTEALANALKTQGNALQTDVAAIKAALVLHGLLK